MKKILFISLFIMTAAIVGAKTHVPDSVMHRDGLYVDNLKIYNDSAIFQGVNLKLDLFNTLYYLGVSKAQFQSYEIALNIRLKQRYYPTLELGYAQGELGATGTNWKGQGGWATLGLDINGLRKHPESMNALLVGIRVGAALQQFDLTNVKIEDGYWRQNQPIAFRDKFRVDSWGEVVAGCQVHIYSGLMMGWYLRLKLLFTRKTKSEEPYPYFIPGFGYRDNTQWGINYYIGWKF